MEWTRGDDGRATADRRSPNAVLVPESISLFSDDDMRGCYIANSIPPRLLSLGLLAVDEPRWLESQRRWW